MTKLRSAIIGCGKMARVHAQALMNIGDTELVAVQSRSLDKAKAFGESFNAAPYTDIATMIQQERVDVVVICTPHPAHREATVVAFENGAHVLVEKPLAISLDDSDAMIAAGKAAGRQLGMISQRRFIPAAYRIKQAIDAGKLGTPMLGFVVMYGWRDETYYQSDPWRGSWAAEGGGVLVNQAPHQLDLLQWYMGSEFDELYGVWSNINHPYIEVDDTAVAVVRFKNGAIANIMVSNAQKPGIYGKVHVHGSNGATAGVQTDGGSMFLPGRSTIQEPPLNDLWTIPGEEAMLPQWQEADKALFNSVNAVEYFVRLQHEDFFKAIQENRRPLVTGSDGRRTVELFNAIYRSSKERMPVKWPL
ncbi:Gfo/Idh/MocA family oxidoreductase [Paraflavitalea sp. CAU 1676]|uniref:Gfo/Idh/MocA family protein n=1 Tax=Paraflavitalea sp. CAU 1676 TaxID=3032598 RepID=UPI0023DC8415|nr:Gfo/Idh/MocA family oxidoreductase [Paraflavitalea sp. CAU 1676]MDF2190060.1 Gfo/Idh/MocA family oxidoreductase [Paraflavitalea sp. CAU 1676]